MGHLGFQELFVISVVALLVLGPRRIPEVARAFGEGMRAFRKALQGDDDPRDS